MLYRQCLDAALAPRRGARMAETWISPAIFYEKWRSANKNRSHRRPLPLCGVSRVRVFSKDGTYVSGGFSFTGQCIPNCVWQSFRPRALTDSRRLILADVYITILAARRNIYDPQLMSARSLHEWNRTLRPTTRGSLAAVPSDVWVDFWHRKVLSDLHTTLICVWTNTSSNTSSSRVATEKERHQRIPPSGGWNPGTYGMSLGTEDYVRCLVSHSGCTQPCSSCIWTCSSSSRAKAPSGRAQRILVGASMGKWWFFPCNVTPTAGEMRSDITAYCCDAI